MATVADRSGVNPTDQKFNWYNRTAANISAILALTPLFPGEVVLALDTGVRYRGLGLSVGLWGQIFVEM
jgi:1,6-anhydro-N-acetylmuramate kinase